MSAPKFAEDKLLNYGFQKRGESLYYERELENSHLHLEIVIEANHVLKTRVIDAETGDEYTLHLNPKSKGTFVTQVRNEYEDCLCDIRSKCAADSGFVTLQAQSILDYAKERYQSQIEFLWKDKFGTDDGVLRRGDTGKWFAAILTCRMKTLTGKGEGTLEVINLRVDPKSIGEIVDNIRIFRAYHMNKKHWISIVLDGGVSDHEIYARIDESYRLAVK